MPSYEVVRVNPVGEGRAYRVVRVNPSAKFERCVQDVKARNRSQSGNEIKPLGGRSCQDRPISRQVRGRGRTEKKYPSAEVGYEKTRFIPEID